MDADGNGKVRFEKNLKWLSEAIQELQPRPAGREVTYEKDAITVKRKQGRSVPLLQY